MTNPTPDDLQRDATADLAVCDAATEGPWRDDKGYRVRAPKPPDRESVVGSDDLLLMDAKQYDGTSEDVALAAIARTALPAWIRRATAAESENRTLCARVVELGNVWPEQVQRLEAERDAARAQVARLREALRPFAEWANGMQQDYERAGWTSDTRLAPSRLCTVGPTFEDCRNALAALAATGDGREEGTT